MTKKRTFGDLKPGSDFWRATPGSVNRVAVKFINHVDAERISLSFSYYVPSATANKASRAIENEPARIYWYVDKKDAQKKAIELQEREIKDTELRLECMKRELANIRNKYDIW